MSRSSVVTYEHVRQACYEILAKGERPTRPAVQELLSTDRYVGQKGSNAVVQNHIQEFWSARPLAGMRKKLGLSACSRLFC